MEKITKYFAVMIAVLCVIIACMWSYNSNLYRSNDKWKHNYEVLQDSVQVIETKYGEVLYERGSLILEKKELEDAIGISKKQVKEYEKALGGKLAYISQLEAQLKVRDTIKITEIIHDTLSNSYSMRYNDDWLKFDETFSLLNPSKPEMSVYNISMNIPLKVGLGDNYTIFVTSPNPYFNVTDIEGAVIDGSRFTRKIPKWSFGAYAGVGLNYDLIHKTIGAGPQVGVGIGFRFF